MGSGFWAGLLDWLKKTLVKEKTISEADLDLFRVVDTPGEAVAIIKRRVVL
jgi:hypothetical protein